MYPPFDSKNQSETLRLIEIVHIIVGQPVAKAQREWIGWGKRLGVDLKRTAVGHQSIRDEEVRAGTGKGWQEWCDLIDAAQDHGTIAAIVHYLNVAHGVDPLWAQIIAMYYKWRV